MQHTTHQAIILQTADSLPVPQMAEWQQFGLVGVIAIMLVRDGLAWWRSKETAEDQLMASLVSDLRTSNQSLIDKLFTMQAQQHQDQAELRVELRSLCERIDKLL